LLELARDWVTSTKILLVKRNAAQISLFSFSLTLPNPTWGTPQHRQYHHHIAQTSHHAHVGYVGRARGAIPTRFKRDLKLKCLPSP